jgi:L-threonylcarbamoyladenylate synthase
VRIVGARSILALVRTDCMPFSPEALRRAASLIRSGRLVAFPTETVYGLGARADDAEAVRGIFAAKRRPAQNPLIVHVADIAAARGLAASWPPLAEELALAFWPGPLTLVVARRMDKVPDEVAASGPTVAMRLPAHPVARALLEASGLPIAAPSANPSGAVSPTTAAHVLKSLDGRIDMILDGGPTGVGIESTIVDLSQPVPVLRRRGAIALETLLAYTPIETPGSAAAARGEGTVNRDGGARPPRAEIILVEKSCLQGEVTRRRGHGERVGALDWHPAVEVDAPAEVLPADPAGYAAAFYAALHRLADAGCARIVAAAVPERPEWASVRDRLARIAGCTQSA